MEKFTTTDIDNLFANLMLSLREMKPNDRSELDRRFAICMTELEKLIAYFEWYISTCYHKN